MPRSFGTTLVLLSLAACGSSDPAPRPTSAAPPSSAAPPTSVADTTPGASGDPITDLSILLPELLVTPTSLTTTRGGEPITIVLRTMRCHDVAPASFDAPIVSECVWTADRCHGTLHNEASMIPAMSRVSATMTVDADAPTDAGTCARFAGTFDRAVVSDPQAGGAPPDPMFPNAECLRQTQVLSADRATCAAYAYDSSSPTSTLTSFTGACCVGTRITSFEGRIGPEGWLSADGRAYISRVHDTSLTLEELTSNPVLVTVSREARTTELHVRDLLAGDPLLAGTTGFAFAVRIDGVEIVTQAIGGAEHRHAI